MTYELALQLKEAGFPQMGGGFFMVDDDGLPFLKSIQPGDIVQLKTEAVYFPALSELIEECGEIVLWACDGQWNCFTTDRNMLSDTYVDDSRPHDTFHGSTPEEAVALLWLQLNK